MNALRRDNPRGLVSDADPEDVLVLIPSYNEAENIVKVVEEVEDFGYQVLVVDDGSQDQTAERARQAGAEVIVHSENSGKGVALTTGYERAREKGCKVIVTMDGDGQHLPSDIPVFVEAYNRTKIPVLIGNRLFNVENMPFIRRLTNRFMSWLLSRKMGQYIPDTQCGFRLFRADVLPFVTTISNRFEAESEVLMQVADRGIRMGWVRVSTVYGGDVSSIKPVRDTFRFFRMLFRYSRSRRLRR